SRKLDHTRQSSLIIAVPQKAWWSSVWLKISAIPFQFVLFWIASCVDVNITNIDVLVEDLGQFKAIVRVYQATQEVAIFKNTSSNTVWQQIGILSQYTGLELFGLTNKITYEAIKEIPSCTSLDWNNEIFEKFEFWTRSENPNYDKSILKNLYQLKFFHPVPSDYQNDGNRFVYHENLGGLCSICSIHGYETFDEFNRLIKRYDELIAACEKLSYFLKKDYKQEMIIDS
ncbi:9262_t:CDS:2, partial [Gigaspora rosea]